MSLNAKLHEQVGQLLGERQLCFVSIEVHFGASLMLVVPPLRLVRKVPKNRTADDE